MSDEPNKTIETDEDDEAIRSLLKRSIEQGASAAQSTDLLAGVQRKLRRRSRGKFYADGWSTTQSRLNYALVAAAMLVVIGIAYFVLGPMGFSAK